MTELENLHFDSPCEITDPDKYCQWILKPLWKVLLGKKYTHMVWKHDTTDYLLTEKGNI